jgi:hypothetical protein
MASPSDSSLPPDAWKLIVPLVGCGCLPIASGLICFALIFVSLGAVSIRELWLSETARPTTSVIVRNEIYTSTVRSKRSGTGYWCNSRSFLAIDQLHWLGSTLHAGKCREHEEVASALKPGQVVVVRESTVGGGSVLFGHRTGVRIMIGVLWAAFFSFGIWLWRGRKHNPIWLIFSTTVTSILRRV